MQGSPKLVRPILWCSTPNRTTKHPPCLFLFSAWITKRYVSTSNEWRLLIGATKGPFLISHFTHVACVTCLAHKFCDGWGHVEKGLPKFVLRSPIQPTRRRGRPTRSGTMLSTDLRGTEGEKDTVSVNSDWGWLCLIPNQAISTSSYWYSGARIEYPSPDQGDSWEICDQVAQRMDKSRCGVWKDDVEKMLIFISRYTVNYFDSTS